MAKSRELTGADGSRLLVLPYGGRLLGLFPPGSDENFLWTNPALAAAESATAYFRRDGWPNPGGDRTWLAPEIELFLGDPARALATYAVPSALDPGSWAVAPAAGTALRLTHTARLRLLRSDRDVTVHLSKEYRPAVNPLRDHPVAGRELQYAGYTQVTALELEPQPGAVARLGLWNLLQLPSPGTMVIGTREAVRPQCVFGTLSADELTLTPQLVGWAMAAPGADAKIAIQARALTGRAGHIHETAGAGILDLVVREFAVDPDGDYVDALWEPPHETGWAFQACCVRNGAERFNELEYHAPAVATVAGRNRSVDVSQVWAFRGPVWAIAEALETLLQVPEEPTMSLRREPRQNHGGA